MIARGLGLPTLPDATATFDDALALLAPDTRT
jgi:hypothetical protein